MLLEEVEESGRVGTEEVTDLVTVLEEDEGGHGPDTEVLCEVGEIVDVELGEVDLVLEFLGLRPPVGRKPLVHALLVLHEDRAGFGYRGQCRQD